MKAVSHWIGWWLINIDQLLMILMAIGMGLIVWGKGIAGWRFMGIGLGALAILAVIPVGVWMEEHLENCFPRIQNLPNDAVGIILLGGSFDRPVTVARGITSYNIAASRMIGFIELAKAYPHLKRVFSGGGNPKWGESEAAMAYDVFKKIGFDPDSVTYESSSKDTIENVRHMTRLFPPNPKERWVIVTSAFHMARAVGLFRKAGWNIIPYPVDYHTLGKYDMTLFVGLRQNLVSWNRAVREWISMAQNYLYGDSHEIFPAPAP